MSREWGREEYAGEWPSEKPVWTIGVLLLALASAGAIMYYRYAREWTPLQKHYLGAYLGTQAAGALRKDGWYTLLTVETRQGPRLALDTEVEPVVTESGKPTFALTEAAAKTGAVKLEWRKGKYDNAKLHGLLGHWIYEDQPLTGLLKPALWGSLGVFALGLVVAIPKDAARAKERKHGRRLKGPEMVEAGEFHRRTHAEGIGFMQEKGRGKSRWLRVPGEIESSHFLIMGDSGTGKSALIRQILFQIEERNETAIVYDPALEYTPEFLNPARGDVVLNPLDERMPYWSPGEEIRHEAEALTLAASLFPDRHNENPFFVEGPRKIFAHLLTLKPGPEEMAWWLCHAEEIDRRVKGTELAAMIDPEAPAQRAGVLASLNMVADTLKLLPAEKETERRWSAAEWSKDRRGWLFLTSTPETRKRLVPLTSLWLDTLVLRLMNQGQRGARPVWFVLDELASLQRLPQLHTAITENRKSNNPVVLGFQGRSQLETRYGHEAEAMLSQPATKIFLRTSEPRAAKWISETIGEVEIERIRESRTRTYFPQQKRTESYGLERQVEPLVMASEISGLPPLRGYLKSGNLVVRLRFPYIGPENRQPAFIERTKKQRQQLKEEPLVLAATGTDGAREQKIEPQRIEQQEIQQQAVKRTAGQRQDPFFE